MTEFEDMNMNNTECEDAEKFEADPSMAAAGTAAAVGPEDADVTVMEAAAVPAETAAPADPIESDKINVLVLGTSGSGKSTLINAVLGEDLAPEGHAVDKHTQVYENDVLPFRMVDSYGIDYEQMARSRFKRFVRTQARNAVRTDSDADNVHMIWFCLDTHTRRSYREVIGYLAEVSRVWKDIPILLVMTKSYSEREIRHNQLVFHDVLESDPKRDALNLRGVISVVAKPYRATEEQLIPPRGLDVLMDRTVELIPEAQNLNGHAVRNISLGVKKSMAHGIVASSVAAATVVGAVPISIADSLVLVPLQTGMLYGIAKVYKIGSKSTEKSIVNAIVKAGITTVAGRSLVSAAKMIPGINIAASALNAIVAGTVTFAAGEICITVFDKVARGELDIDNIDWAEYITHMFNKLMPSYGRMVAEALDKTDVNSVIKNLVKILTK